MIEEELPIVHTFSYGSLFVVALCADGDEKLSAGTSLCAFLYRIVLCSMVLYALATSLWSVVGTVNNGHGRASY